MDKFDSTEPQADLRILWLGPVLGEAHFANPAVSPAAALWQQDAIDALMSLGAKVDVLTHLPQRAFPLGPLWAFAPSWPFSVGANHLGISFWNLPCVRAWHLRLQYEHALKKMLASHHYDLVISYNAESYLSQAANIVSHAKKIPWVAIVADLPKISTTKFIEASGINKATARLYLSWHNFCQFRQHDLQHDLQQHDLQNSAVAQADLFFEGGVSNHGFNVLDTEIVPQLSAPTKTKRIAYFGGLTPLGGIDLFLDATTYLKNGDLTDLKYEFHVVGNGNAARINAMRERDPRIIYHGALAQDDLIALGKTIDCFIDPRPKAMSANNFPSKVLTYLGFTKPIISTMGLGLSPEYAAVLIALDTETPENLAQTIQGVLGWCTEEQVQYQERVRNFVKSQKSWDVQAKRLNDWIRSAVLKGVA